MGEHCMRVADASMVASQDESFPEGSMILVEPYRQSGLFPLVGQLVVARMADGRTLFRMLCTEGPRYVLAPLNPQYPVLPLEKEDRILGVVTERYLPPPVELAQAMGVHS